MVYHETEHGVLYQGDCLDILPTLGVKADLVLTDPPYGLGIKLHNGGTWATNPIYDAMPEWDNLISQTDMDKILESGLNAIVWGGNYTNSRQADVGLYLAKQTA